ncbi:lytic murein transglycosylase [Nocardia seriolae]|uniref:lytic transglycosylase domain-containing protein n=1 Tax=Nocardia seriolae TaxID=37332 RepID=UPI0004B695D6|nr:lytic murein transglycosylase [Nocardia seriolae]MTJ65899.1 lytic transglycosylase [Nocardia seriolae]MTJ75041.1 lytic transglycosylase [Nocardia seriolae]MTJ86174.1 lytic transglycosylase [Nocardia seriolae]MTK30170.1 lytic transglycosylase [Nocardia seriolae]MTK43894.1 lytic transglycosylase [Nocardia seriolae]
MAKRISAPVTASALLIAGLVTAGSTTNTTVHVAAPQAAPDALLAAAAAHNASVSSPVETPSDRTVGLVPAAPEAPRKLSAMTPPADGVPLFGGTVPLRDIALPGGNGVLGIPEIVLAAYRNAELALQSSDPNCHLPWYLLAGIGRIESNHADNGRTDTAGTTVTPIYGPALDSTLPGNEIIKAADGNYVRAIGPMQFLPSTWSVYAANGKGSGTPDPNNVFDAALAAGKYLCSGGMDLADPAQQLRAVLRYNNSVAYAANVLSWANAYRTGGTPQQVTISPDLVGNNYVPVSGPDIIVASTTIPATTDTETTQQPVATTPTPTQVMITIPGLPPIPCGIFCPAPVVPANPCEQVTVPAQQLPESGEPGQQVLGSDGKPILATNGQPLVFGPDGKPVVKDTGCSVQAGQQDPNKPQDQPQQAVQQPQDQQTVTPTKTPEAEPMAPADTAPDTVETTTPAPGITLPFGITIPLPAPAPAPAP